MGLPSASVTRSGTVNGSRHVMMMSVNHNHTSRTVVVWIVPVRRTEAT